ncbi:unnamed protein product [Bursaphelenchus xylophilus]|nr:unnamed protein product [Bursaphelenchus xylophilus]CAG9123398.1 unnamed protein product [Bursaphelenchus xylophilus]
MKNIEGHPLHRVIECKENRSQCVTVVVSSRDCGYMAFATPEDHKLPWQCSLKIKDTVEKFAKEVVGHGMSKIYAPKNVLVFVSSHDLNKAMIDPLPSEYKGSGQPRKGELMLIPVNFTSTPNNGPVFNGTDIFSSFYGDLYVRKEGSQYKSCLPPSSTHRPYNCYIRQSQLCVMISRDVGYTNLVRLESRNGCAAIETGVDPGDEWKSFFVYGGLFERISAPNRKETGPKCCKIKFGVLREETGMHVIQNEVWCSSTISEEFKKDFSIHCGLESNDITLESIATLCEYDVTYDVQHNSFKVINARPLYKVAPKYYENVCFYSSTVSSENKNLIMPLYKCHIRVDHEFVNVSIDEISNIIGENIRETYDRDFDNGRVPSRLISSAASYHKTCLHTDMSMEERFWSVDFILSVFCYFVHKLDDYEIIQTGIYLPAQYNYSLINSRASPQVQYICDPDNWTPENWIDGCFCSFGHFVPAEQGPQNACCCSVLNYRDFMHAYQKAIHSLPKGKNRNRTSNQSE